MVKMHNYPEQQKPLFPSFDLMVKNDIDRICFFVKKE